MISFAKLDFPLRRFGAARTGVPSDVALAWWIEPTSAIDNKSTSFGIFR